MTIDVELFGHLAPGVPRRHNLVAADAATALDIAVRLGLDPETIGLVTINGVLSEIEERVPPGARLCFFPPLSGG